MLMILAGVLVSTVLVAVAAYLVASRAIKRQTAASAPTLELCDEPLGDTGNRCEFVKGHGGLHGVWVGE